MHDEDAAAESAGAEFGLALDELLHAWSSDRELTRAELLARHPGLGSDVDRVFELAREMAVSRPTRLPLVPGYDLLGEAGRGGMGVVYRARQHGVDRVIALKVLPEAFGVDARGRARFLAEARGLGRIRHVNVVTIYGVVESADVVACAMEWVNGRSLASLLEELGGRSRRGPVPDVHFGGEGSARLPDPLVPWFCRVGVAIARALAEVHRHGLVHRDVKPSNVLLRDDGTPLLADFGLVRADALGMTRTGQIVGTPAFSAPEQLRASVDVGPRADVFGLGATLHCALAGQVPFAGRTPLELLANIESRRRRSLVTLGLPKDLETIVAKCIEPEVGDRYATAGEVADDLESLLALRPVRARPLGMLERGVRLARRNRRLVVASVLPALVVLAASVAVGMWLGNLRTLSARFGEQLKAARLRLLEPTHEERVELAMVAQRPQRPSVFETSGQEALKAYADALALDDSHQDVAMEHDVVALAQAMLLEKRAPVSGRLLSAAPCTCAAAAAWCEGREVTLAEIGAAASGDRRALGLLAFLTGRVNECHTAWAGLEMSGDTFIDAAAGQMHLQRGEFTAAGMRLSRATQTWPEAGFLAVALADCAVRGGDLPFAERELDRADHLGRKDPFSTHKRVLADLRAKQGRFSEARDLYEWLLVHHRGVTARRHYAQMLERIGDRGRLVDVLLDLAEMGSSEERPALAVAAARWWREQTLGGRVAEFDRLLEGLEPPGRLRRLTMAAQARRMVVAPERGTLEKTDSSSDPYEATSGFDELMEITQMESIRAGSPPYQIRTIRHLTAVALAAATSVGSAQARLRAGLVRTLASAAHVLLTLGACAVFAPLSPLYGQTFSHPTFQGWGATHSLTFSSAATATFTGTSCIIANSPSNPNPPPLGDAFTGVIHPLHQWDPALQGPIRHVYMSVDSRRVGATGGQSIGEFLAQGGTYYFRWAATAPPSTTWTNSTTSGTPATQYSFAVWPGMTGSLDFSASGSPITFGLLAANSTGPGGGQYTSTQEYRNWTLTIVPAGLFSTFGYGCQGSTGVTSTMGNDNFPGLGFQNFRMNLSNAPGSTLATLVLGFSQLATPVPGAWFGAPGCDLLISPDIVHCWVVTGASGTASSWPIPIPSQAASLGQTFYGQWLVFDTPANPLGITTSNGGAATIQ